MNSDDHLIPATGMLAHEDDAEMFCLPCAPSGAHAIPIGRVIEKLDEYLNADDLPAAERHLRFWREEAETNDDLRGKLTVLNEQIGLYRKMGNQEACFLAISSALPLLDVLDLAGSVTAGTTLVNAATGYKAFGKAETALPLYEKARAIYGAVLPENDARIGGLCNNEALALVDLGRYEEAERLYRRAMDVMSKNEHGEAETAVSLCNLADLIAARDGVEAGDAEISACLDLAEALLDTPTLPRNGYYAYVCEKCAPTFGYYGYFLTEQTLKERAKRIYERS